MQDAERALIERKLKQAEGRIREQKMELEQERVQVRALELELELELEWIQALERLLTRTKDEA